MKILLVGSGGREHALAWRIAQSPLVSRLFCAPGNPGINHLAKCVAIGAEDIEELGDFAEQNKIDLTVVGPERPLIAGIVDHFRSRHLTIYGPTACAARLEGSKAFTNELAQRAGIPAKEFAAFSDRQEAREYVQQRGAPIVVKADGDAAGKGVTVATTVDEALDAVDRCMVHRQFAAAGDRVVIEERLQGPECSIKVFTDGETVVPMVPSQDYKPIYDGNEGPNTGGMGCYSPVPIVDDATLDEIVTTIIEPTVRTMAEEGTPYTGTLYAGCMLTEDGPRLLEYNCRFGDPETQVVLPRMETDLVEVLLAVAEGRLDEVEISWRPEKCVCVVVVSGGYPGPYEKGKPITGLREAASLDSTVIFHAGTARRGAHYVTNGGRVLGVTALGDTYQKARDTAYNAVGLIDFDGIYFRTDIAERAVGLD